MFLSTRLWPSFALAAMIILALCGCSEKNGHLQKMHAHVQSQVDSLILWLDGDFIPALEKRKYDHEDLRRNFLKGRKLYKEVEFAIEYFFPNAARNINGPALPEIEPEEHTSIEPGGFQVLEELLFPTVDTSSAELLREARKLKSILARVQQVWPVTSFREDQVFDALRQECFRIIALGLSGFDTPLSLNAITEVPVSLRSVGKIADRFPGTWKNTEALKKAIEDAIRFSTASGDFNSFDRMHFIRNYVNPLTRSLLEVQKTNNIPVLSRAYALRSDITTLFDSSAFQPDFFSPDPNSFSSPEKVELGRKLFFDPILSDNFKISCASCHQPSRAFTDGMAKSRALGSKGFLARNTPTVLNAGLQKRQFYDMRSAHLEDQVRDVISNADEFHGSLGNGVRRLSADTVYSRLFTSAFPAQKGTIRERDIQAALACYIRSLTSFHSRFDRHMRQEADLMNASEINGFNIFMGKAKCGICHFVPVFNGTVPPSFTFTESEVIGTPADLTEKQVDPDRGRYNINKIPNFRFAFKTPTLRNIELTAPYMHNGVYSTLEQVVEFYDRGGGNGLNFNLEFQTLPADRLELSKQEKSDLIAFLKTLTDASRIY